MSNSFPIPGRAQTSFISSRCGVRPQRPSSRLPPRRIEPFLQLPTLPCNLVLLQGRSSSARCGGFPRSHFVNLRFRIGRLHRSYENGLCWMLRADSPTQAVAAVPDAVRPDRRFGIARSRRLTNLHCPFLREHLLAPPVEFDLVSRGRSHDENVDRHVSVETASQLGVLLGERSVSPVPSSAVRRGSM